VSFGYLIIVSDDGKTDYHMMAYLLALSIKRTQKAGYDNVALVTDSEKIFDLFKTSWVFDKIEFWNKKDHWDGRSYMNKLSPWKHTVCLDADMIFLRDTSHWIDHFVENCDLYIASKVLTYRNETVTSDYYRKTYKENELPMLYSAYTFFKKESPLTHHFFDLVQSITDQKEDFKNVFLEKQKPSVLGTDEIFSLAAKILDIQDQISYPLAFPKFVHMKPMIQNLKKPISKWPRDIGFYTTGVDDYKIGSFTQYDIIHYVEKDFQISKLIEHYDQKMKLNFKL
jgi:ribonuclease HI